MESQPQNPEFRNNPENFHPCKSHFELRTCIFCWCKVVFCLFVMMLYIPNNNFSVMLGRFPAFLG